MQECWLLWQQNWRRTSQTIVHKLSSDKQHGHHLSAAPRHAHLKVLPWWSMTTAKCVGGCCSSSRRSTVDRKPYAMEVSSPPAVASRCAPKPKWERYRSACASTRISLHACRIARPCPELGLNPVKDAAQVHHTCRLSYGACADGAAQAAVLSCSAACRRCSVRLLP